MTHTNPESPRSAAPAPDSQEVRWAACPSYEDSAAIRAAVAAAAGDLSWVRPGMRIAIKLNLVHACSPDAAATTHPALVEALIALLREKGAEPILGDSPGGLFTPPLLQRVYRACGVAQLDAPCNLDCSTAVQDFPQGKVLRQFTYTAWLDSCDAIINFGKLKTHGMLAMTAAVKNLFGVIPGTMKPEYHFRFPDPQDFAAMLVDLQRCFRPQLHLLDAVTVMEGNGPTAGTPRPMGLILGSENPFALDQLCAQLLGLAPREVRTVAESLAQGLMEPRPLPPVLEPYRPTDFRLPPAKSTLFRSVLPGRAGVAAGKAMERLVAPKPVLSPEKCVGCGLCQTLCPAHAITLEKGRPSIRRSLCIRCFCCQEFCPKGALEAHRSLLARLLTRETT